MNADWVDALRVVEAELSREKDSFALFGIFLPMEAGGQWDLVLAAPWARRDDRVVLEVIGDKIMRHLRTDILRLARFVVVETWHPGVQEINSRFDIEHGLVSFTNEETFGYMAERALIITSKDYWRFVKQLFPANAQFTFSAREGDLIVRVSWLLNDDPSRPWKRSKNVMISFTEESLALFERDNRRETELRLAAWLADQMKHHDPHHDAAEGEPPPTVRWRVTSTELQRPALAVV